MLLGELVKDDIKNSLYAKTKDYYTEGSKDDKAKDFDLGKALTGLVDFAYEGISEDSKSMDDDLNGKDIIVIEGNFKNKRGVVIDDRSDSGGFVKVKFSNGTIGLVYAKNIQLSSKDSCKVGDVTYGGKGYRCVKCGVTADSVHKIVHVKDANIVIEKIRIGKTYLNLVSKESFVVINKGNGQDRIIGKYEDGSVEEILTCAIRNLDGSEIK